MNACTGTSGAVSAARLASVDQLQNHSILRGRS